MKFPFHWKECSDDDSRALDYCLGDRLRERQPVGGLRFDWMFVVLSTWLMAGGALDVWAHLHTPQLETVFTPWHAALDSGFFAVVLFTVSTLIRHRALPSGYGLSLVGIVLFFAGGFGDMVWHILFGIEVDFEALISPTHLVLTTGAALMVTGPLRAAWRRSEGGGEPRTGDLGA